MATVRVGGVRWGEQPRPFARGLPAQGGGGTLNAGETLGHTALVVLADDRPAGVIVLTDRIRPAAAGTVTALRHLTGTTPVLLTGDNAGAAGHLARQAGIGDVHAGLLPENKADRVLTMQSSGAKVLLAGDGVNDAPALATADLGVAMGRKGLRPGSGNR